MGLNKRKQKNQKNIKTVAHGRKSLRRSILSVSITFLLAVVVVFQQLMLTPPASASNQSDGNLLKGLFNPSGFVRIVIIPNAGSLVEQVQKNATLKKLLMSRVGGDFFSSPPLAPVSTLFRLFEVTPDTFKPALIKTIFPSSLRYVSSEYGSILVAPVTAMGRALLEKKMPANAGFSNKGDFILATKASLLQGQMNAAQEQGLDLPFQVDSSAMTIVFAPENDINKEETSLFFGAYRAFFPPSLVKPQVVSINFDKQGIEITSRADFYKSRSLEKTIAALPPLRHLPKRMKYDGLLLEFAGDSFLASSFMNGEPQTGKYGNMALYLHRFAADFGRTLPDIGVIADSRDRVLTDFLSQAFKQGAYKEEASEGSVRLLYGSHRYANKGTAFFSPQIKTDKGLLLWGAGSESYQAVTKIASLPATITSDYAKALKASRFQPSEKVLLGISGNLNGLLLSLEKAATISTGYYASSSFGDFKDTLKEAIKDVSVGTIDGFFFVNPGYLRGRLHLKL